MLSVIFWVAFGIVIGWVAAILRDEKDHRRIGGYLLMGALGGLAGGFLGGQLDSSAAAYHTATTDIMFAVFGATAFILFGSFITQKYSRQRN